MAPSIRSSGDRRRARRFAPKGNAQLVVDGQSVTARLINIGDDGMLVLAEPSVVHAWAGRVVELAIRFDGARAEWIHGTGHIERVRAPVVAISFDHRSSVSLREALRELATELRAQGGRTSVVLVDADVGRRAGLAAGFRAAGCTVEEAATPLEAIVVLGSTSFEPDVIAIADSVPSAEADDMRAFVLREHPGAMLVTIGDDVLAPDGALHWLSSADPEDDLARRVRSLLRPADGKA